MVWVRWVTAVVAIAVLAVPALAEDRNGARALLAKVLEEEMAANVSSTAQMALDQVLSHVTGEGARRRLIWQAPAKPLAECARPLDSSSVVLVTGAAGFVGHALAKKLSGVAGTVIGIDDYNDYYSPLYKKARAVDLRSTTDGTRVMDLDVCDHVALENLIFGRHVTHVVHLAAQAGVRFSKAKPETYIRQNIKCFLTVLEIMRASVDDGRHIGFVFASSSSVYGDNTAMPFSESDAVDQPNNLYGATKRANELMAQSYSTLFGVNAVGLRFFTVYGPWGRPDMAGFSFVRAVLKGLPIKLFRKGDMIRDFTYIDDIVEGIMGTMKLCDSNMQVFNLGCSDPIQLMDFVGAIERHTGRKAIIEDGGPGEGEIYKTYANVSKAERLLGYHPTVNYDEGIRRFVEWYKTVGENKVESWYSGQFLTAKHLRHPHAHHYHLYHA